MAETTKRIYIGGGPDGEIRLANIKKLANQFFEGNVSALFNDALDRLYKLDRYTGEPLNPKSDAGDSLLKDAPRSPRGGHRRTIRPKPSP